MISHYLVLLSHTFDEIPLFLSSDLPTATSFAKNCDWNPPEKTRDAIGAATSSPVCIKIIEFQDGFPVRGIDVRSYEDESENTPTENNQSRV